MVLMRNVLARDAVLVLLVAAGLYFAWGEPALNRLEGFGILLPIWALIFVWRSKKVYGVFARHFLGIARWMGLYLLLKNVIDLVQLVVLFQVVKWDKPEKLLLAGIFFIAALTVGGGGVIVSFLYYHMTLGWRKEIEQHSRVNFKNYVWLVRRGLKLVILVLIIELYSIFLLSRTLGL